MKKRTIKHKTDALFPRHNFWIGMGSILNLAGSYFEYNHLKSVDETDLKALTSDWDIVGEDLRTSKHNFGKTHKHKLCLK